MPIARITPNQAKEILDQDPEAIYVDVRSIPEFTQGHPIQAVNIPLMHYNPAQGGMVPNPDFPKVAQAALPRDKKLLVGCKAGPRAQKACEILSQQGFQNLFFVDGGFGGNDHQKGWKDLGLPVNRENGEGVGYESLKAGARLRPTPPSPREAR